MGALFVTPDVSSTALLGEGRKLAAQEKLNTLGIGVREAARGRGVNLAMAAYGYLQSDPQGREVFKLHAGARRQLAVAADGGEARRQGVR